MVLIQMQKIVAKVIETEIEKKLFQKIVDDQILTVSEEQADLQTNFTLYERT